MELWNEYLFLLAFRTTLFFHANVVKAAFKTRDYLLHLVLQSRESYVSIPL
jgi:hypothetical protein